MIDGQQMVVEGEEMMGCEVGVVGAGQKMIGQNVEVNEQQMEDDQQGVEVEVEGVMSQKYGCFLMDGPLVFEEHRLIRCQVEEHQMDGQQSPVGHPTWWKTNKSMVEDQQMKDGQKVLVEEEQLIGCLVEVKVYLYLDLLLQEEVEEPQEF